MAQAHPAALGSDRNSVQSVERAADLLLALASAGNPPTLRELSAGAGISASTCLRLLTALEKKGLVERQAGSRRFRLGAQVLALARGRSTQEDLLSLALPEMRRLRERTGETVSLHVRTGDQHVCIAEVESYHEVRRRVEVGRIFPLTRGATGRVFRAYEYPAVESGDARNEDGAPRGPSTSGLPHAPAVACVAPGDRQPHPPSVDRTPHASQANGVPRPVRADGLPRTSAEVRRAGFAASVEEREPGASAISAPIFGADGGVRAALTVSGPANRFGPAQMRLQAAALQDAAASLSAAQGSAPPVRHATLSGNAPRSDTIRRQSG